MYVFPLYLYLSKELIFTQDPDIVLLPPSKPDLHPAAGHLTSLCAALATRSGIPVQRVRALLKADATIHQWGKVRRVDSEEGDIMHTSSMRGSQDDARDATYVRVSSLT